MLFFFNDTATTEIYTLSLHDALPIFPERLGIMQSIHGHLAQRGVMLSQHERVSPLLEGLPVEGGTRDRKSTRLNSSHGYISYAVFCLKKKKNKEYCSTTYQVWIEPPR